MIRRSSTRSMLLWSVALIILAPLAPAAAEPDDGAIATVAYSYEKWSRTGDKRYVLVPRPVRIPPGDLPDRVRSLFRHLVEGKSGTYGNTRLAFQPDAAKTGVVYVYLDESKRQYHPIVMAETVYTFTENGATRVMFPKVVPAGWTRADVPFPAYVLQLELWQALPPGPDPVALVRLPDGSLLPSGVARERLQKADPALLEATWSYVERGGAPALAAVRAVAASKPADLDDRLIPVLKSADEKLRAAALDGLAGRDNAKVNAAVRAVMDGDPSPALRDKAAEMLSRSQDPKFAVAAQYHALSSDDPKVVAAATRALGASKEKEAGARLLELLGHTDEGVRAAAIASLMQRGDHAALAARLDDAKVAAATRIEIARALADSDDAAARQAGLRHLVVAGSGDDSAGAAAALAKYDRPETYEALGKALKHAEPDTRRAAAAALSRLGKPAALPLLAAADVEDPESGESVLTAIRTLYAAQSLDFVLEATRERNPVLRRSAVATLGDIVRRDGKKSQRKVIETLRALAGDTDANIRAAAVRSFEIIGADEVRGDVLALAADGAIEVKRAVAHALRVFPGPDAVKHLLGYVREPDPVLLANALGSLGVLQSREALDPVVSHLNHDDVRVRRAATEALVHIGKTLEKREPLLSFFSERVFDKDADIRLVAVQGLRLVKDPRTVTAMAALLQDPVVEVRKATLLAMAATGDPSAVEPVATGLEDDSVEVRRAALEALATLKSKAAIPALTEYAAREKVADLADEARRLIRKLQGT